ncbi:hypothetical protein BwSF12_16000 [Bradyrhizobium ottawaense]|nr:hypothetical protein BwSF12_16000 [Bradyrhizobium ottawaense]
MHEGTGRFLLADAVRVDGAEDGSRVLHGSTWTIVDCNNWDELLAYLLRATVCVAAEGALAGFFLPSAVTK